MTKLNKVLPDDESLNLFLQTILGDLKSPAFLGANSYI